MAVWIQGRPKQARWRYDLYLETDLQEPGALVDAKLKALSAIKYKLGDQKIDLVIYRRGQLKEPIHNEALNTGIQL